MKANNVNGSHITPEVKDIAEWLQSNHPDVKTHFLVSDSQELSGTYSSFASIY